MKYRPLLASIGAGALALGMFSTTTSASAPDDSAPGVSGAPEFVFPVAPGDDWPEKLVLTLTPSQETGGLIESAQPLADALAERLGIEVEATVPSDYTAVITALESGEAHIAGGLGPLQMVQAEDEAGASLILQAERFGSYTYVTQWFSNDPDTFCSDEPAPAGDDGFLFCNGVGEASEPGNPIGLDNLTAVEGKNVAFVDPASTSGYLVPALELLEAGIDPESGITANFAGGHPNAVQSVYDGSADVGVSFNDARGDLFEQYPDVGEKVVVFGWSEAIPNDGFAVGGDLPQDLQDAITAAIVDYASSEEGTATLQALYEIDGVRPVVSSDYDVIRELRTKLADLLQ